MLILAGDIGWTFTRIACFGIAGPVRNGRPISLGTLIPPRCWGILGLPSVRLLNDLEAN